MTNQRNIIGHFAIIREEADHQQAESLLTKSEILSIINSLTPLLGDSQRSRFRGLSSKSRNDLVNIFKTLEICYLKISIPINNNIEES